MSTDGLEIAKLIEKGKAFDRKWNIYKIFSGVVSVLVATLYLGAQFGDWREWRRTTTQDVTEIKEWRQSFQADANSHRNAYNNSIKIKP